MSGRRHDSRLVKIHYSYTTEEAASLLGIHKNTLTQWRRQASNLSMTGALSCSKGACCALFGTPVQRPETKMRRWRVLLSALPQAQASGKR